MMADANLRISFVIPAHNEEQALPATLAGIQQAAQALGLKYEIIVVADSCSDRTVELARAAGGRVLEVKHRQIAATRNSGGRAAEAPYLFFIDADTQVRADVLQGALRALENGAAAGGALVKLDEPLAWWGKLMVLFWIVLALALNTAGGCFLFCRREAFAQTGGFPENLYAAEELIFVRRMKRVGRFVLLKKRIVSSGRKVRTYSFMEMVRFLMSMLFAGPRGVMSREKLDYFYTRRTDPKGGRF